MPWPSLPSGLAAGVADIRHAINAVQFARPSLLWVSFAPLVVALLAWLHARQRRQLLASVGRKEAIASLVVGVERHRNRTRFLGSLAWVLLAFAIAGPRWGKGDDEGVAIGRDVILVVDLSRSMLAKDLVDGNSPRWRAATDAALDLVRTAENRGGHRIGIVVFAARAKLVVPLTTDYAHVRAILSAINGEYPPDAIRPADDNAISGTRIGSALQLAVESHDNRFPGYQDVILLTDGDDPKPDREWATGVTAARNVKIPVHVVGIGDPEHDSLFFLGNNIIEGPGEGGIRTPATTRLHEDVAKAISDEAHGSYIPARRDPAALGEFFRTKIEPLPSRELTDDGTPQLVDRSAWFLLAGLLCLLLAWRLS